MMMKLRYEGTKVGGYDGYEGRHDSVLIFDNSNTESQRLCTK